MNVAEILCSSIWSVMECCFFCGGVFFSKYNLNPMFSTLQMDHWKTRKCWEWKRNVYKWELHRGSQLPPTGKYYMYGICTAATIAVDATTAITIIVNYHQWESS